MSSHAQSGHAHCKVGSASLGVYLHVKEYMHGTLQAFDLAVLKLKRPVTAVGGYFNYDCFAHRNMPPGGEAASAGPGVPLPPPPPPPPPAPAIVGSPNDVHSVSADCSPRLASVADL